MAPQARCMPMRAAVIGCGAPLPPSAYLDEMDDEGSDGIHFYFIVH